MAKYRIDVHTGNEREEFDGQKFKYYFNVSGDNDLEAIQRLVTDNKRELRVCDLITINKQAVFSSTDNNYYKLIELEPKAQAKKLTKEEFDEEYFGLRDSEGSLADLQQEHAINMEVKNIMLTTESPPNLNIIKRIDVITAECVYGMNIFRDVFAGVRDIVGGRSGAQQNVLRDARETVLKELRKEAHSIGANAVIAVDLDYNEISGGGKSGMLMVVASGTAVVVEQDDEVTES